MAVANSNSGPRIGVVSALKDEANQFQRALQMLDTDRDAVQIVQTGLGAPRIVAQLNASLPRPPQAMIMFGTAGGVAPDLDAGDIVIYDTLNDSDRSAVPVSSELSKRLHDSLAELRPRVGKGLTVSEAVCSVEDKQAIHARAQCLCVDMESATVATWAHEHRIPFACVRAIVDGPRQAVPSAALKGMKPDGTSNAAATLLALVRHPQQLPEVIRLGQNYAQALRTLASAADLIVKALQAQLSEPLRE